MENPKNTIKANKPKLLVCSQLFYPELVSTGQTITELCEELSQMGIDIEVLCGPPTLIDQHSKIDKETKYKNIKIRRVWGTRFPKINLLGKFLNHLSFMMSIFFYFLFNKTNKHILVLTNPPLLGFIVSLLSNNPFTFLVFDVYPETIVSCGLLSKNHFIVKLWHKMNNFILKKAKNIIVIGRDMEEIIKNKTPESLHNKINLIHVWCDDKNIHQIDKRHNFLVKEWSLDNKFVVLYSGNMGRFHDLETIMESAKLLNNKKNIVFLFVGEGHKKSWAQNFARNNNLINCQFHTYVPRKQLSNVLSLADIGLVSLLDGQEGLSVPSKTFGLWASSIPVIAIMNQKAEIARIIKDNNCGLIVKPGKGHILAESILKLFQDEKTRQQISNSAKNVILRKYSLNYAAQSYYKLIQ